jgi:hypothetical protein
MRQTAMVKEVPAQPEPWTMGFTGFVPNMAVGYTAPLTNVSDLNAPTGAMTFSAANLLQNVGNG